VLSTTQLALAQLSPIVDLGYAQYQGAVNPANSITHFLGIRYAAPPLGELLATIHPPRIPTQY
jgi:carboxylesterase type B